MCIKCVVNLVGDEKLYLFITKKKKKLLSIITCVYFE